MLLKDTLKKFEVGSKSLNMILTYKGHVFRRGIGFVRSSHQNSTTFIKGPILHVSYQNKCNFCCKHGHRTYHCPFKKVSPNKLIWVPKGTMTNSMQHDKKCRSIYEAPKANGYLNIILSCRKLNLRKLGARDSTLIVDAQGI